MNPRQLRLATLNQYYQWADLDQDFCVYCADRASSVDHVPALHAIEIHGAAYFHDQGIPIIRVPACLECNTWLSDQPIHTVKSRRLAIGAMLKKKYRRVLVRQTWTPEDLAELGHTLRTAIQSTNAAAEAIRHRIAYTLRK